MIKEEWIEYYVYLEELRQSGVTNMFGATQASVLGVSTLTYLPFCFFNIISPFMTMMYAIIGIKIKTIKA